VLIDRVELGLSHVDLGRLGETALLALFGTAQAHRLTVDTGHSLRDISDANGALLYPGYYWTHLRVPPSRLLGQFRVWDTVAVGVDVARFGAMLSSSYVLGRPDELDVAMTVDALSHLPSMRAGSMFFVDDGDANPRPGTPKRGAIAAIPDLSTAPPELRRFREVRDLPSIDPAFHGALGTPGPISYQLRAGHQIHGEQSVMFARYVGVADAIERELLVRHLWPPFPAVLIDCLEVLERETCYFANVRGERTVRAGIRARLAPCPPDFQLADHELAASGILTSVVEIYDDTNILLATSKASKVLAVPKAQQRLVLLAARALASHGKES
jgi:probable biosynthetic protein (TIGR04098 family)